MEVNKTVMDTQMQKNSAVKKVAGQKLVQLKVKPLEGKVTPCCTAGDCFSQGLNFDDYRGECITGKLAVVADY